MREYFLKTSRIRFSRWSKDDLELADSLWGDPDVTHFICANGKFTPQEIKDRLDLEIENYEKYKVQYFPIFELSSEVFIGCCGGRPYSKENNVLEIGFHLRKEYWNQGFAFEAAAAVIQYCFTVLKVSGLKAGHHPHNAASKILLQKLGFQYEQDNYYEPTGLLHPSYRLTDKQSIQK